MLKLDIKLSYFMTHRMINLGFRNLEKTILKRYFPHLLKANSKAKVKSVSNGQICTSLFDSLK